MPLVTIDGPTITDMDVKRALVRDITAAVVKAYKLPAENIIVTIKENKPDNVGIGGILISDRRRD